MILCDRAVALLANIRLGWKRLRETNTLAYYEHSYITVVKSFMTLAPGLFTETLNHI
jgi:hypothetical protein